MKPLLNEEFVIKGTVSRPALVSLKKSQIFPLNEILVAEIMAECNGKNSLEDISKKHRVPKTTLLGFLKQFQEAGLVSIDNKKQRMHVPINLDPLEPWLQEVHMDLTDKCNLADFCKHCFRGEKLNKNYEKSFTEWEKVLDDMSAMGVYKISLSGGEIFLRNDLDKIVDGIISRNLLCAAIFSNGTIWNEQVVKVIRSLQKRGVDTSFYISLDGFDAETNDALRGSGSFQKTLRFIEAIQQMDFPVTVNSQVNQMNFLSLLPWYEFLKKMGIKRWRMTSGRLIGRLKENSFLCPPLPKLFQEYKKLINRHFSDFGKNSKTMRLSIEGFFRTEMLLSKKAMIFDKNITICDYKKNGLSIEPTGDVQFCTSWGDQCFGNVFQEKISNIWHSEKMQLMKNMTVGEIDGCQSCDLLQFCGGGCRLLAKTMRDKDETACQIYKHYAKTILPLLEKQRVIFSTY